MVVETTSVVDSREDEDSTTEEALGVLVESNAVGLLVENMPVDIGRVLVAVLVARLVWGWLLVLGSPVLTAVVSEVVEMKVVGGAAVRRGVVLGGCTVDAMVGLTGAGAMVLGVLVLAGTSSEVLGARLELEGELMGGFVVVRGGWVRARRVVVCSLGTAGCVVGEGDMVVFWGVPSSS